MRRPPTYVHVIPHRTSSECRVAVLSVSSSDERFADVGFTLERVRDAVRRGAASPSSEIAVAAELAGGRLTIADLASAAAVDELGMLMAVYELDLEVFSAPSDTPWHLDTPLLESVP